MKKKSISRICKRILAMTLASVMVLGSLPATTFAEETAPAEEAVTIDPADSSKDYPCGTVIYGSQLMPADGNEGPATFSNDGNAATYWHTDWRNTNASDIEKRYIGLNLDKPLEVDGIRYLPRPNNGNGAVSEYKVQYKTSDDGEWMDITSGTWDATQGQVAEWKLVSFEPVVAKQVRLVGVHTRTDTGNDNHMTAAEFYVTTSAVKNVEVNNEVLSYFAMSNSETLPVMWDNDGPAEWAFDTNEDHYWHARYNNWNLKAPYEVSTGKPSAETPIWIQTGFGRTATITKLTYAPRKKNQIGKDYSVWVAKLSDPFAVPSDSDFVKVKEGVLSDTQNEQVIKLDNSVEATHVRLQFTSTQNNTEITARRIKVYELVDQKSFVNKIYDSSILALKAKANSAQGESGNDGPAKWAFDGNHTHWYHSKYNDSGSGIDGHPSESTPIWIQTGFGQKWYVSSISYAPRQDGLQCNVKDYSVWVANMEDPSQDPGEGLDNFTMVASGTLKDQLAAQVISFDGVKEATHIRLCVTSVHNHNNNYVTAQSIKVLGYDEMPSVPEPTPEVTPEPTPEVTPEPTPVPDMNLFVGDEVTLEPEDVAFTGDNSIARVVELPVAYNHTTSDKYNIKNAESTIVVDSTSDNGVMSAKIRHNASGNYWVNTGANNMFSSAEEVTIQMKKVEVDGNAYFQIAQNVTTGARALFWWPGSTSFNSQNTYASMDEKTHMTLLEKTTSIDDEEVIPGYKRVENIENGKSYLISFVDDSKVWILTSGNSTVNQTKRVEKNEAGVVVLRAVSEGQTTLTKNDITYDVHVYSKFTNKQNLMDKAYANSYAGTGNDGDASFAFNGVDSNWWHSNYSGNGIGHDKPTEGNPIYIQTGFGERYNLHAITYASRNDVADCVVNEYEVYIADLEDVNATVDDQQNADIEWTKVAEGNLENTNNKQWIYLDDWYTATHVRFVVISVYKNMHVTAREIAFYGDAVCDHANVVVEGKVEADCTEDGYTGDQVCTDCGAIVVKGSVDTAKGHKYEAVVTEPTCKEAGYTTYTCACGDTYKADEVPATGKHAWGEWEVTKEATCTEDGEEERTCGTCGDKETQAVEAEGHKYEAEVTEPTCKEAGYTTYTCACGDTYKADEVPATGKHAWGEWEVTKEATCTEDGEEERTCGTCGDKETQAVEAEGHTEETVAGKDATCTETGLTEGKKCSVCGTTTVAQETIPATGKHIYADGVCKECGKAALRFTATAENGEVEVTLPEGKAYNELELDDKVTVVAKNPAAGYEFAYWVDVNANKVVSYDESYTVSMITNHEVKAVFTKIELNTVVFKTTARFSNKAVYSADVEAGTEVVVPTAPVFAHYEFTGWDSDGNGTVDLLPTVKTVKVTSDMVFEAVYVADESYTITVSEGTISGGELVEGKYVRDALVTVKANPAAEGQSFAGWYNNGVLISTKDSYSFYVKSDMTLEARYVANEEVVKATEPTLVFAEHTRERTADGKDKIVLRISWDAESDFKILGEGFIRTFKATSATEDAFVIGTSGKGITTKAATQVGQRGNYTYTLNIAANSAYLKQNIYVRGYVRYQDADGNIKTLYTDVVTLGKVK